jgi:hypothetical protein
MGYVILRAETGQIIMDTRLMDLDGETLNFIAQLEQVRDDRPGDKALAAKIEGLIEAAVQSGLDKANNEFRPKIEKLIADLRREHANEPKCQDNTGMPPLRQTAEKP